MRQYIADAFAEELFTGNPAAVLPCKQMPDAALMQNIAIENNYSETAFVVKTGSGAYDLRWFTPGGEIDLCGHATLASAYVVSEFVEPGVSEMRFQGLLPPQVQVLPQALVPPLPELLPLRKLFPL